MSLPVALFWVAAAVCAVAQLLIVRSVFSPHPDATGGDALRRSGRLAETVWALLPALILALVLALTWRAVRADTARAPTGDLRAPHTTNHASLPS
ncbi:MAG TPA: hypothetical protein VMM18_01615 [Gemmatimonadaceae bacterium]|nr:hypothetical protein [Gemmatimonadaceae bacterium]